MPPAPSLRRLLTLLTALLLTTAACRTTRPAEQSPPAGTTPHTATPEARSDGRLKSLREVVPASAAEDAGLFTIHRTGEKLYFEIHDSLFGRDMLLVSRLAGVPGNLHPYISGGWKANEQVVRWDRRGRQVLLRAVSYGSVASDTLPVYRSVRSNNFEPVLEAFAVEARGQDTASVVVEVTKLFSNDLRAIGLPANLREQLKVRRLDPARSYLESARSFPLNVEVRHVLTYEAERPTSLESTNTVSVQMSQSLVLLPADPMARRLADERVGWFTITQVDFGLPDQKAGTRSYLRRWRLEPSDPEAYARGELVEPVKPIVYYLDPATPEQWRPYIRRGIEDWQHAFEVAGFKNAILAKDPPSAEEDSTWSPEDIRYSTVRWIANETRNAMGPSVTDPRTGEIIESDILWYHNHLRSYRNRLLIETGAQHPEIGSLEIPEPILGETMRQVIAHEVGHALGLPHNMISSSAYPVDSLRSGSFTRRMGIAPSIMDYARQNYIAQPGDDVRYIRKIGPYDLYAINWGYRVIPGAATPADEEPVLDAWIREKAGDPVYRFGTPGTDPRAQTEDLGDDNVKASRYAMANLRRVVPNLIAWTSRPGESYDDLEELYGELLDQWSRYVGHVVANVGGVHETRKAADEEGPVFEVVPAERQRAAMAFLREEVFETPAWLLDETILSRIEPAGGVDAVRRLQARWLDRLLDPERIERLIGAEAVYGEDVYTALEMLGELRASVWSELPAGTPIDAYRRNLQRAYLDRMAMLAGGRASGEERAAARRSDVQAFVRGELQSLQAEIRRALGRYRDVQTRYHLEDVLFRIDEALRPQDA